MTPENKLMNAIKFCVLSLREEMREEGRSEGEGGAGLVAVF